jgi:hypothetical protein
MRVLVFKSRKSIYGKSNVESLLTGVLRQHIGLSNVTNEGLEPVFLRREGNRSIYSECQEGSGAREAHNAVLAGALAGELDGRWAEVASDDVDGGVGEKKRHNSASRATAGFERECARLRKLRPLV